MKLIITERSNYNQKITTMELLEVDKNITKNFNIIGKQLVRDTRKSMRSSKSGVKYNSLPKRSSAIGESLASQNGMTLKTIKYKLHGAKYMDFGGNTKQLAIWEGDKKGKYNNRPTLLNEVRKQNSILANRFGK